MKGHTFKEWVLATRPWSFPASTMPVLVAMTYLWSAGFEVTWWLGIMALVNIVLVHAAGNVWSDYHDYRRGVDAKDTYGVHILTDAQFTPKEIYSLSITLQAAAIALGLLMVWLTGITLLWFGLAGIALSLFYPPLKYAALGDLVIMACYALLPMLGTLGSRLRARYLDGAVQSPSFQCEIEAPMASGKSFVSRIYDYVMKDVLEEDEENRAKEEAYDEKVRRAKNAKEQPAPESYMVRLLGAKVSISKLMDRLAAAHGLHVFTYTDEVANVLDGIQSGKYGDIRALLRNAFDNQRFSQEYKSDNSSKKMCRIFYNTLHCGTPAEYKKLYKNVEDGTVTRITFATLPDQAFKKMPRFKELTEKQKRDVDRAISRISGVSCVKGKVQPEHLMELGFLNEWADKWLEKMRKLSAEFDNRSLDTFRRRSAVVGFRAGMIAYYLYGRHDKVTKAKTCAFAEFVAEQMVTALLRRYTISEVSNVVAWQNVWNRLDDEFSVDEVEAVAAQCGIDSPARNIVYKWKAKGLLDMGIKKNQFIKRKIN